MHRLSVYLFLAIRVIITFNCQKVNVKSHYEKEPRERLFFFSAICSAYSAVRFFSEISIAGEA